MVKKFAIQDGAQFYIFGSEADAKSPNIYVKEEEILSYSTRLLDHDIADARRAREWAIRECSERGIELNMVGF